MFCPNPPTSRTSLFCVPLLALLCALSALSVQAFADPARCKAEGLQRYRHHATLYSQGGRERLHEASRRVLYIEERQYRLAPLANGGEQELYLTVYRRADLPSARYPALLQIHGGGWIGGTRSQLSDFSKSLAAMGSIVISVDYRFAPANPYPAAPEDIAAAADWIAEHADELGVDRARPLSVFGFSAGAHLANLFAQTYSGSMTVGKAVIFAGRSDLTLPDQGTDYAQYFLAGDPATRAQRAIDASPIHRIRAAGLPKPEVLLMSQLPDAEIDWRESCRFHDAYRSKAGSSRVLLIPEATPRHGPSGAKREIALQAIAIFLGLI